MKHLEAMIDKINKINSKDNLNKFFSDLEKVFNYSWAGMIVFEPSINRSYITKYFGNIPSGLINLISKDQKIKQYCLNESSPINYRDLFVNSHINVTESLFTHQQIELIIPINGFGSEFSCLIFAIPIPAMTSVIVERIGWYWLLLSALVYSKYRKNIAQNSNNLTKRELECIRWASEGKTSWEISRLLTISQRTVDFHLANCITKTDSINRQQAIVKCVLNGQLLET